MSDGVLLLGASGFLGRHVLRALRERGHPVRCLGRTPVAGADWTALDLRDRAALAAELDARPARLVVNCAALSRGADCAADEGAARALNAELPGLLAERCARLVHVSTDLVFDGDAPGGGWRESDAPRPLHVYGATKAAGERAVLAASRRALVVRLPLLFGESLGRGLGASDALLAAVARGERPALFTDEWRTPLDVEDAARALVHLAEGGETGLLHVAGPERVTRFELGARVLAAHGLPQDAIRPSTRHAAGLAAERPRDVSLNAERARAALTVPLRGPRERFAAAH